MYHVMHTSCLSCISCKNRYPSLAAGLQAHISKVEYYSKSLVLSELKAGVFETKDTATSPAGHVPIPPLIVRSGQERMITYDPGCEIDLKEARRMRGGISFDLELCG